jgi:hypothetical protein
MLSTYVSLFGAMPNFFKVSAVTLDGKFFRSRLMVVDIAPVPEM